MRQSPALVFAAVIPALAANCADSRDLRLINGKIATMGQSNSTDARLRWRNGTTLRLVSDEGIKHIHSGLTLVDGKVGHNDRKAGQ